MEEKPTSEALVEARDVYMQALRDDSPEAIEAAKATFELVKYRYKLESVAAFRPGR